MFGLDGASPPKLVDAEGNELTAHLVEPGVTMPGKVVGVDRTPGLMGHLRIVFEPDSLWVAAIKEKMAEAEATKAVKASGAPEEGV